MRDRILSVESLVDASGLGCVIFMTMAIREVTTQVGCSIDRSSCVAAQDGCERSIAPERAPSKRMQYDDPSALRPFGRTAQQPHTYSPRVSGRHRTSLGHTGAVSHPRPSEHRHGSGASPTSRIPGLVINARPSKLAGGFFGGKRNFRIRARGDSYLQLLGLLLSSNSSNASSSSSSSSSRNGFSGGEV